MIPRRRSPRHHPNRFGDAIQRALADGRRFDFAALRTVVYEILGDEEIMDPRFIPARIRAWLYDHPELVDVDDDGCWHLRQMARSA